MIFRSTQLGRFSIDSIDSIDQLRGLQHRVYVRWCRLTRVRAEHRQRSRPSFRSGRHKLFPIDRCSRLPNALHVVAYCPPVGVKRLKITTTSLLTLLPPCKKKDKSSPYSITERRVPELIPVLGSQPAGDVSHKCSGSLPLLFDRPAVTPATLKWAATNFAAWWTEAQWVWAVCLKLLPDSVATTIWTRAFCAWVQHSREVTPLSGHFRFVDDVISRATSGSEVTSSTSRWHKFAFKSSAVLSRWLSCQRLSCALRRRQRGRPMLWWLRNF